MRRRAAPERPRDLVHHLLSGASDALFGAQGERPHEPQAESPKPGALSMRLRIAPGNSRPSDPHDSALRTETLTCVVAGEASAGIGAGGGQ